MRLYLLAAAACAALLFAPRTARADWKLEDDGSWVFVSDGVKAEPVAKEKVALIAAPKSSSGCACGEVCPCLAAPAGHYETVPAGVFGRRTKQVWVPGEVQQAAPVASLASPCAGGSCPAPSGRRR